MGSIATEIRAGAPAARERRLLHRVLVRIAHEPFFQFIALGALLFAASEYFEIRSQYAHIDVSRLQIEGIANNYRLQYGTSPTAAQLDALVEKFIQEEVYYHEALRLKLDQDDEIIRRRLVQKYEFLQQDLGVPTQPAEADLRAFYRLHAADYTVAERLTFSQVFFAADGGREEEAGARAERVLAVLDRQQLSRAPAYGDNFPGAVDYADVTPTQVRRAFGSGSLADSLFKVPPGSWAGPLRSGFGWHLVYVAAHAPAVVIPYPDARDAVVRDYLDADRGAHNAQVLARLKQHFIIVRK